MIKTIGNLLESIIELEKAKLSEYGILKHPGIIGEMYEGLSQEIVAHSLLPVADLRVVKGKIRNSKGDLSSRPKINSTSSVA